MTLPKSITEDKKLLSTSAIAEKLGVHRSTVHGWIKSGMLKSEKHGRYHGVRPKDLERFLSLYEIESKRGEG